MAARLAVGTLLLLCLLAAGCSSEPSVAGEVGIHGFAYEPASITVRAGEAVRFTNHDTAEHSVTADGGAFDVEVDGGGGSGLVRHGTAGTFAYHCKYHAAMRGTIVFT